MRYETREGSDFGKHSHLVQLGDHGFEHFAFEWPKNYGFVFNRIHDESLSRQYEAAANVIDVRDGNHKTVPKIQSKTVKGDSMRLVYLKNTLNKLIV